MLALLSLTALLVVASTAVTLRLSLAGRAERALVATLVGSALVLTVVYAVGFAGLLDRRWLIGASAATFAGAFLVPCIGPGIAAHSRAVGRELWSMARLPIDALVCTARERSFSFLGVVSLLLLLLWAFVATYVAQSDGWDGLGYHEPMLGYAIQERSLNVPAVVPRLVFFEAINGNPRHSEMISLWLVMLLDRRLIELPSTLAAPTFLLAIYLLCRRFGVERSPSIGLAAATLLMPGAALLLRSTYIDLHVAAFDLAALYLVLRPGFRSKDALISAVAIGLMLGIKVINLAWAPPLAVVALVRFWIAAGRERLGLAPALGWLALASLLLAWFGAAIYVRNWALFGSPIWPFGLTIRQLGIDFPGIQSGTDAAREQVKPLLDVWLAMAGPFKPGQDFPDTRVFGYGLATPYLWLPLGVLAVLVAAFRAVRALVRRLRGRVGEDRDALAFFLFAGYALLCVALSPGIWQARYNLHVLAMLLVAVACLLRGLAWRRVLEGLIAITLFVNVLYLHWARPGLNPGPARTLTLLGLDAERRAATKVIAWTVDDDVALAREQRLGPGDLVVYTRDVLFIGPLWNERYSNRVEYWPPEPPAAFMKRLDERNARWVVTWGGSNLGNALYGDPRWRALGRMSRTDIAFERVQP
ncbi:MAG: hypothetical protein KF718_32620 [Polyangiaceae bacterium]|nr:hypothetical protein [Polyangiaceae bacterium]